MAGVYHRVDLLKGAIDAAKQSQDPIELINANTSYFKVVRLITTEGSATHILSR
jgi:hypothetical protein